MKIVQLTGIRQFAIAEEPEPTLQEPDQVLLKILRVGICGSDIHYYLEGAIGEQIIDFPFTIGHEFSGVVAGMGEGVTNVEEGDLVAAEPAVSCMQCDQCLAGRPHTCRELQFIGAPGQLDGAMKEYISLPARNCYPVPGDMSPEDACLVEPLSIGCYAVQLAGDIGEKSVGILGVGPIGLGVLAAARNKQCGATWITDKLDYRCELAEQLGADWTGNPETDAVVEVIRENDPLGLDYVFECCGDQEALDQAIEILKPGGELLIIGIPRDDRISFDISRIRRKEITIKNVRRQNHCIEPAIDLLQRTPHLGELLWSHGFSADATGEAFETVSHYRDNVVKAMIHLG